MILDDWSVCRSYMQGLACVLSSGVRVSTAKVASATANPGSKQGLGESGEREKISTEQRSGREEAVTFNLPLLLSGAGNNGELLSAGESQGSASRVSAEV
jgi:hypothetical protein